MSDEKETNGFGKWQTYILEELKDLKEAQRESTTALNGLIVEVAVIKAQAATRGSIWGAVSGIVVVLVSAIITYAMQ